VLRADRDVSPLNLTPSYPMSPMTVRPIELVARRLAAAKRVAVITGAGISAESGLRTFRGATTADLPPDMQSLWKEFDPATLATPEAFARDPAMVSKWYDWRRMGCLAAEPNPGHRALAALQRAVEAKGGEFVLLTQNVDRLHQRAGSIGVVELHGTIMEWRCTASGERMTPPESAFRTYPPTSPFTPGALLRPDVVWFGEMLPPAALAAAASAAGSCDVFMSIGTSAVVYPAAGFLFDAKRNEAFTIEVNLEATPASEFVDATLGGSSSAVLPALVRAAFGPGAMA